MKGRKEIGGLIGYAKNTEVQRCGVDAEVKGESDIGGLLGRQLPGTNIRTSYATGMVTGIGYNIGGLVGYRVGDSN